MSDISINVNSGFKINCGRSIKSIQEFNKKAREHVYEAARKVYAKSVVDKAVYSVDEFFLGGFTCAENIKDKTPMEYAHAVVCSGNLQAQNENQKSPYNLNFSYGLTVTDKEVLAVVFTDSADLMNAWMDLEEVQYYAWNSGERPKEITQSRWDKAGEAWSKALAPEWKPIKSCMMVEIVGKYLDFKISADEVEILKQDERAVKMCETLLTLRVASNKHVKYVKENGEKKFNEKEVLVFKQDVDDYVASEEGQKELEEMVKTKTPNMGPQPKGMKKMLTMKFKEIGK